MRRWLAREWSYVLLFLTLVAAMVALITLRSDPAYPVISTPLSIFIGGLSSALLQGIQQARERQARREESRDAARRAMREARLLPVKHFFEETTRNMLEQKVRVLTVLADTIKDPNLLARLQASGDSIPLVSSKLRTLDDIRVLAIGPLITDRKSGELSTRFFASARAYTDELNRLVDIIMTNGSPPLFSEVEKKLDELESEMLRTLGPLSVHLDETMLELPAD